MLSTSQPWWQPASEGEEMVVVNIFQHFSGHRRSLGFGFLHSRSTNHTNHPSQHCDLDRGTLKPAFYFHPCFNLITVLPAVISNGSASSPPFTGGMWRGFPRSGCTHCVILHPIMSPQVLLCLFALPLALSGCIWDGAFPLIDPLPGGVTGRPFWLVPACLPSEWTHRESCVHVPGVGALCPPVVL